MGDCKQRHIRSFKASTYVVSVEFETESSDTAKIATPDPPVLIRSFPASASDNSRHIPESGVLVFSDHVYEDGELRVVKEADVAWQNRGNTMFVYGGAYVRHWDTYSGHKHRFLFSANRAQKDGIWSLGEEFISLLAGTTHDDFDVSRTQGVYVVLDPELPPAWHAKQNVILSTSLISKVTSGKHYATHSPVPTNDGTKVAWAGLSEDGYESDLAAPVAYDLKKGESYNLTPHWDRSPASISFSEGDKHIYFTAGSEAHVKVFMLSVPASEPGSDKKLASPSSPYLPNDVHTIRGPDQLPTSYDSWDYDTKHLQAQSFGTNQLTRYTEELKGKYLDAGEEFYFDGAQGKI
ncbi:hypothetical protein BDM02DRAFT_3186010 [Thelephora ganbajun]|uniref:Uncharacterized protein n=1 Tax=Thelephora ganbajun TaxID=370292 RepID=A0ACB6ZJE1_THEGA|nr:hypothetical protein BDM02DRAFT_3186010 [Thelephora ganbajun]